MAQNLRNGGEGIWEALMERILSARPDVLVVNEAKGWDEVYLAQFEAETGLKGALAPARSDKPVGVFYNPETICNAGFDSRYSTELHHGCIALSFEMIAFPGIVIRAVAVHLNPWCGVEGALGEVGCAIGRASYAKYAVMIGDFNYCAAQGPGLNIKKMKSMNHASRCYPRRWFWPWLRSDRRVGRKCLTAGFVDAAIHMCRKLRDRSLLAPTTPSGRIDLAMVSKPLVSALVEYFTVAQPAGPDHAGVVVRFNLSLLDTGKEQ